MARKKKSPTSRLGAISMMIGFAPKDHGVEARRKSASAKRHFGMALRDARRGSCHVALDAFGNGMRTMGEAAAHVAAGGFHDRGHTRGHDPHEAAVILSGKAARAVVACFVGRR